MYNFKLTPSACISEKEFRDKIGQEKFEELTIDTSNKSSNICLGCGYVPVDKSKLQIHVDDWDRKDYKTAQLVLLCEGCHAIKHLDVVVKNDCVRLCNSILSQGELMLVCRKGLLNQNLIDGKVFLLNRSPQDLLNDLSNTEVERKKNDKVKIIFGKKFKWNN